MVAGRCRAGACGAQPRRRRSDRSGRVDYRGTTWDAESGERIPEGATVEILDKENLTLIVKKI